MRTPYQTWRLNQQRKAAGLSQAELAAKLGVTQPHISQVIAGRRHSPQIEEALSALLGVEVRDGTKPRGKGKGQREAARKRQGRRKGA